VLKLLTFFNIYDIIILCHLDLLRAITQGDNMLIQMIVVAILGVGDFGDGMFVRGDANYDGRVDISDVIVIWRNLMNQEHGLIACPDAGDANDDGELNFRDPLYILNYLFSDGSSPPMPFEKPGIDLTFDQLGCD